jgi:hypothetical protein
MGWQITVIVAGAPVLAAVTMLTDPAQATRRHRGVPRHMTRQQLPGDPAHAVGHGHPDTNPPARAGHAPGVMPSGRETS